MQQTTFIAWRYYLILALVSFAVLGLSFRIFNLAIFDQHFLRKQGDERVLRLVSTPAFRGMIVDRNGFPLAVSTTVYSAWMNPHEVDPVSLAPLAKLLTMKTADIITLLKQKKKREFVYLKRALSPEIANQIKALEIPGIYLQKEYRRYYPEGEATSQLVGFTNIDDQGQEGLELGYNNWLQGEPGKKWVIKDRLGRVISDVQTEQEQRPGHDLVLSIDRRIQYLAYRELMAGVMQNQAKSGSVIVLDVKTGEVLAMVNYPSFNPNNRQTRQRDGYRNRAVTDTFEPGSTIKAFTVTGALETGRFKADAVIDTSPGWIRIDHNVVKDEKNNGPLTITEILQHSSNIGAAKIVLALPPNELWSLLHRVGFGEATNIGFPGEQDGSLTKHSPWGAFTLATLSFGYGLTSTALQLTRAYAVLANDGVKLPVSLLRLEKPPVGERVINAAYTRQILTLLESVVEKGTAQAARIPGYRVSGKTGTAKIVGQNGYEKHRYNSSFVGTAPLSHPRFIVAVIINDPQGKNFLGGFVSAPVFQKIMEGTLRLMSVPPDAPIAPDPVQDALS